MNKGIIDQLTRLSVRLEELDRQLSNEKITVDLDNYRKLSRERSEIEPVTGLYHAYQQIERDLVTARK